MKHKYTDKEIQAAIAWACRETYKVHDVWSGLLCINEQDKNFSGDAPARLHLLKSALDKLLEPQPPTADGKTPGQVCHESMYNTPEWKWLLAGDKAACESAASAVLAAFGGAGLEAAIARMEAVTVEELWSLFMQTPSGAGYDEIEAIKCRLIAAAREGQPLTITTLAQDQVQATAAMQAAAEAVLREEMSQPAEIPWTEWRDGECPLKDEEVEEWEFRVRSGEIYNWNPPSERFWRHDGDPTNIIAYRVTKWREGFGPAAVDWKAKCDFWNQRCLEKENDILLQQARAEKAESELANAKEIIASMHSVKLSTLRPIAEAGEVPAGAVRVWGYYYAIEERWTLTTWRDARDTHFADILLPPEAKAPAVEAAKRERPCGLNSALDMMPDEPAETFEAHGKTWTVHAPGDPMPCDGGASIMVLFSGGTEAGSPYCAADLRWNKLDIIGDITGWRYADEPAPAEPVKPWTPAVGDVVTKANPVQDMALGGQMYWRDLARQLAEVWWKCHTIGASLQHGDIDSDVSFSVVCEKHGGQVFHADTPHNAWLKAEKWLMSPDRENFPIATLQPA